MSFPLGTIRKGPGMNAAVGSYVLEELQKPTAERARLAEQARMMWQEEKSLLLRSGLRADARVLDLGCGTGEIARRIATEAPDGQVVGVDADPGMLPAAPLESNLRFVCARAGQLPASIGTFDLVYMRFLLQHLSDPRAAVSDAVGRLSPGGVAVAIDTDDALFLMDPPDAELEGLLAEARRAQRAAGGDRRMGRKLPGLLSSAGLDVVGYEVRHLTSTSHSFEALYRLATGFKAGLIGAHASFDSVGKRLADEAARGERFLAAGVCVGVGRKRGDGRSR